MRLKHSLEHDSVGLKCCCKKRSIDEILNSPNSLPLCLAHVSTIVLTPKREMLHSTELSHRDGWKKCGNYKHFNEWKILFRGGCLARSRCCQEPLSFASDSTIITVITSTLATFATREVEMIWSLFKVISLDVENGKFLTSTRENLNSLFPYPFIIHHRCENEREWGTLRHFPLA